MIHTKDEDIALLKSAYRNHQPAVTLSDGREIVRRQSYRHNSCAGCVFMHLFGCYCEFGEVWISKNTYEDEQDAIEQRQIDIDNCVKWCENFNKEAETNRF